MLSIENQAIVKKAKFKLGDTSLAEDLSDYCVEFKLPVEVIQELVNYYSNGDSNFVSQVSNKLSEKGISI